VNRERLKNDIFLSRPQINYKIQDVKTMLFGCLYDVKQRRSNGPVPLICGQKLCKRR